MGTHLLWRTSLRSVDEHPDGEREGVGASLPLRVQSLQARVGGNLDAFQTPSLWRATLKGFITLAWRIISIQPSAYFLPWEKEIGLKTIDLSAHDWFPWQQSSIASLSRTNQELSARTKDNLIAQENLKLCVRNRVKEDKGFSKCCCLQGIREFLSSLGQRSCHTQDTCWYLISCISSSFLMVLHTATCLMSHGTKETLLAASQLGETKLGPLGHDGAV